MTRVAGALTKSGEVMKLVNNLMKVPQLQRTMVDMAKGERRGSRCTAPSVQASGAWQQPSSRAGKAACMRPEATSNATTSLGLVAALPA
jgi:hypothetical protein